jgi:hypothetical protein
MEMEWRQTELEYLTAMVVRALRRDPVAHSNNATRGAIDRAADKFERGEYIIKKREDEK